MDLEENIRIAATMQANKFYLEGSESHGLIENGFIKGAKSQAAKDFWYNEFKRQKLQSDSGQDQTLRNQPLKPSECFNGKSEHQMIFDTVGGPTDEENELWQKQVVELGYEEQRITIQASQFKLGDGIVEQTIKMSDIKLPKYCPDIKYVIDGSWDEYQEYIKEHPNRPISFNNWKYMVEHYVKVPSGYHTLIETINVDEPHIINGKVPHYPHGIIQSDPLYGATKKDFDDAKPKNIGIIGSVGSGVAILGMDLMSSIQQISFELMNNGEAHIKGVIAIVPDQKSMEHAEEITRIIAADSSIHKIMVITKEHYDAQGTDSLLKQIKSITSITDVIPQCINGDEYFKQNLNQK